ncbi:MAG: hypothetical protein AAF750_09015 [Planctomycetota bacterium]
MTTRPPAQHSRLLLYSFAALIALAAAGLSPASAQDSDAASIYDAPDRNVTIRFDTRRTLREIPRHFLGINNSYFNDTDEIWEKFDIPSKLKHAGIGAMRFPGGEETSFYHWRHPGVNGYEDIWDDPSVRGTPVGRGPFQVTWVDPAQWNTNQAFLDFDEFIAHCVALNIEPVVGINMSSARKHDRIEDGINEALEWLRYCKEKGYEVKYWYLDNEPWHQNANYTFDIVKEYGPDVLRYGRAIKKEFPDVKLIVNPLPWGSTRYTDYLKQFLATAGPVIDYIDLHYYWAWGLGSWDYWLQSTPLTDRDKWTKEEGHKSIGEICNMVRSACGDLGLNDVGIMFLEWNIGPSDQTAFLSESAIALIHGQYLMELIQADVEMTCLWPLLWRSRREVWPEQDRFPSIIRQSAPYTLTATAEVFALFANLTGQTSIQANSNRDEVLVISVYDPATSRIDAIVLNKRPIRQRLSMEIKEQAIIRVTASSLDLVNPARYPLATALADQPSMTAALYLPPFSVSHIQLLTQPRESARQPGQKP